MKFLYSVTVVLLLLTAAVWVSNQPYFHIATIDISNEEGGQFEYANKQQVFVAIRPYLTGSFFRVNVHQAERAAEAVAWVADAKISRVPPSTIKVVLRENKPVARWIREGYAAGLINQHGEVFQAAFDSDLPEFDGDLSVLPEMLENYKTLSAQLQPLRLQIIRLQYSPRLTWSMMLDNGVEVRLGKQDIHKRIALFAQMWPRELSNSADVLDYVDMRYPDGFATRNRAGTPPRRASEPAEAEDGGK